MFRWGIYVLVLEKAGFRSKVYIGSGTSASGGVSARLKQYDDRLLLPQYLKSSLHEGFTITQKGLLCWTPIPTPAQVPMCRLLLIALEATFSYVFWSMRARLGNYGMTHLCPWDISTLEYDGLCSHCALDEGFRGDYDLSPEQLEAQAVEKEKKRVALKAINATNHHHKQMATNYTEYMGKANARVMKSRAKNPGRDAVRQEEQILKALEEKTYHCEQCNLDFGTKQRLEDHENTDKHKRKPDDHKSPFYCPECNIALSSTSNFNRHNKTEKHLDNYKAQHPESTSSKKSIADFFKKST